MRAHDKHIFVCNGPRCDPSDDHADEMMIELYRLMEARPELRIKRGRSQCMMACAFGPALVIYPEGTWYRCDSVASLERIVTQHIDQGIEVRDLVMHRLGEGDVLPPDPVS